jgi:site-specific recombinase XerD
VTALAPTLEAFFTERLLTQREASQRTVESYRDTLRLLLVYAGEKAGKSPCQLDIADVDAVVVSAFLTHLEHDRHNSVRSRNTRLAGIHSLFRYAALRHPEHAALIQRVLAIPTKRYDRAVVNFLTREEVKALLAAPDRANWIGRRDHTLLAVAVQTGLRVTELTGLTLADVHLGVGAHVRCHGKGRKERATPLNRSTVALLRGWIKERGGSPGMALFPTGHGRPLSSDAIQWLLSKYTRLAAGECKSLAAKKVSPHVLRHTCAMNLLQAGVDTSVIALWLGHESTQTTQIYLHADLTMKEHALSRTTPADTKPGRYRPPDELLAFLERL